MTTTTAAAANANAYPTPREGFFVYRRRDRVGKWTAQRKWPCGFRKSAVFYSVGEAVAWLDALPPS